jgi:CarD family transcriptional regulator
MAQKMAPSNVASKKAAHKKPTARKDSQSLLIAKPSIKPGTKTAKAKPAIAVQAPKRTAKAAAPPPKPHKAVVPKSVPQVKAPLHKVVMKEAAKAHPAPRKHEGPPKAAAPKATAPKAAPPKAAPPKAAAPVAPKAVPMPPPPLSARPAASAARTMPASMVSRASQKIMAPRQPQTAAAAPAPALPAAPKPPVAAAAAPQPQQATIPAAARKDKAVQQKLGFKVNEWIVYPAHGVGRIIAIEDQEIAGLSLELFVITFEKDKMTLRVPTGKSASVGMRKLAEEATVKKAIETLKGRARVKRTMWSRRAQEYEAKINSGDLIAIAEVVRDLYRSESQPEQSYSERQLYEAALDRMAREIAVVEKLDERGAVQRITEVLSKSARGRNVAAEAA